MPETESRIDLERRNRRNADGDDETRYLLPIQSFAERRNTPAEELLEKYYGAWQRSVEPAFEEQEFSAQ